MKFFVKCVRYFFYFAVVVIFVGLLYMLALSLPTECEAAELPWQGAQYQFFLGGSVPLLESTDFRGSVAYLTIPSVEVDQWFSYFGPAFNPTEWLWVAPQVGAVSGWSEDGEDGFLLSLWNRLSFLNEDFRVRDGIGCGPIARITRGLKPFTCPCICRANATGYVPAIVADVKASVSPITRTITNITKTNVIPALNFSILSIVSNFFNTLNGCD